jgi:hypothetical protein
MHGIARGRLQLQQLASWERSRSRTVTLSISRHGSQPVAEARSVSGGGARLLAGTCHDALHSSHAAARYTLSVPPDTTALHMLREEA